MSIQASRLVCDGPVPQLQEVFCGRASRHAQRQEDMDQSMESKMTRAWAAYHCPICKKAEVQLFDSRTGEVPDNLMCACGNWSEKIRSGEDKY